MPNKTIQLIKSIGQAHNSNCHKQNFHHEKKHTVQTPKETTHNPIVKEKFDILEIPAALSKEFSIAKLNNLQSNCPRIVT